jgi:chemotaxis protein MotB
MNKSTVDSFIEGMAQTFGQKEISKEERNLIQMRDSLGLKGKINLEELDDLNNVLNQISTIVKDQNLQDNISMNIDNRGVTIVASESMFFQSGRAEILPAGQKFLYQIFPILGKTPYDIQIEGHTDNVPIRTLRFPSNWELSAIRATNVVKFFIERCQLPPERFSAMGFAEYRPLFTNTSTLDQSKNRRVEIIILRSKFRKQ